MGCCKYEYDDYGKLINYSNDYYLFSEGKFIKFKENNTDYLVETDKDGFITLATSNSEYIRQTIGGNIIRKYTYTNGQKSSMEIYWNSKLKSKYEYYYDNSQYGIDFYDKYPNIKFKGHPTNIKDAFGLYLNNLTSTKETTFDDNGNIIATKIYDSTKFIYDSNGLLIKKIYSNGDSLSYYYEKF